MHNIKTFAIHVPMTEVCSITRSLSIQAMSDPNPWPAKFQRQLDLANKQISIVSWGIDFRYKVGSGYKLGRECVPYKLIQEFGDAAIIQSDVRSTWKSDPNGKYTLEEMCQTDECKELLGQWLSTIAGWVQSSTNQFLVLSITCSFQCTSSIFQNQWSTFQST